MMRSIKSQKRWNFFARTLEDLLQKRGLGLDALRRLDCIYPANVNRLKESLVVPMFHLLNIAQLEQVFEVFAFTIEEQLHVHAAILTTAVEKMIADRIDIDNALLAAEEVFPIFLRALQKRVGRKDGLAVIRGEAMSQEETAINNVLESILEQFDRAMLALYLSQSGHFAPEKIEQAKKAHSGFTEALANLEALRITDPEMATTEVWQTWHEEACKNLIVASENLSELQPASDREGRTD